MIHNEKVASPSHGTHRSLGRFVSYQDQFHFPGLWEDKRAPWGWCDGVGWGGTLTWWWSEHPTQKHLSSKYSCRDPTELMWRCTQRAVEKMKFKTSLSFICPTRGKCSVLQPETRNEGDRAKIGTVHSGIDTQLCIQQLCRKWLIFVGHYGPVAASNCFQTITGMEPNGEWWRCLNQVATAKSPRLKFLIGVLIHRRLRRPTILL